MAARKSKSAKNVENAKIANKQNSSKQNVKKQNNSKQNFIKQNTNKQSTAKPKSAKPNPAKQNVQKQNSVTQKNASKQNLSKQNFSKQNNNFVKQNSTKHISSPKQNNVKHNSTKHNAVIHNNVKQHKSNAVKETKSTKQHKNAKKQQTTANNVHHSGGSGNQGKGSSNQGKGSKRSQSYWNKANKIFKTYFSWQMLNNLIFSPSYLWVSACVFVLAEVAINLFIIDKVSYTEIDWNAYMQEVEGFINGTTDYSNLKGGTGPLVYPAGFLYIFSVLYYLTDKGTNLQLAQYIYAAFYLITISLVFRIYHKSRKLPPYILLFVCFTSYRIHSIFVLRLFNDPVAMMLFYAAVNLFIDGYWTFGSLLYSFAVSVKMNILLFAPALFMSYLYCLGPVLTLFHLIICAGLQVLLAIPFLLTNPMGYIQHAFNLGRVFLYEWTVNWRVVPEQIFVNQKFHIVLLAGHVLVLCIFAATHWHKYLSTYKPQKRGTNLSTSCHHLLLPLFMSNFIGMVFSRSLHYQFYVWYFHSLPYLLWSTNMAVVTRLLILGVIELCWNIFPATTWSSALLHVCHLVILGNLMLNKPAIERNNFSKKKVKKN